MGVRYNEKCPALYDEPTTHSAYHINNDFGKTENHIIKYECVGKQCYNNMFKNTSPMLIFTELIDLSNKVHDLSTIPKQIIMRQVYWVDVW